MPTATAAAPQENKIIRDFTHGNLPKQMLYFSIPFMFSNALQVFYAIVDMIVVGNFVGSTGLAAVSTASMVVTFMTMLCLGFATSGQVFISQLIGAGKHQLINKTIGTLFTIICTIGLIMTFVGIFWYREILTILQTPPEAFAEASQYLLICSAGILFTYGYNMVASVLRGMGNSKQPCLYIIIAALVNLVLDLLFVAKFNMGVWGAAVATVIGQAVSFIWSVIYLYRNKEAFGFDFKLRSCIPDWDILKKLTILGIPFALMGASINISMMFVTAMVNSVSVEASAVFGVGLKVDDIARKITMGVNYSVSAVVGQNIGAGNTDRTREAVYIGWFYSFLFYLIFFFIYIYNAQAMFRFFTTDAAVLALAPTFVSAIIWAFPAMIIMRGTNGFIQGIGNSRLGLIFALLDGYVCRIGFSYLLGHVAGLGLYGYFLGYGLATYGTAIPGLIYFLSGIWKKRSLAI